MGGGSPCGAGKRSEFSGIVITLDDEASSIPKVRSCADCAAPRRLERASSNWRFFCDGVSSVSDTEPVRMRSVWSALVQPAGRLVRGAPPIAMLRRCNSFWTDLVLRCDARTTSAYLRMLLFGKGP